LYFGRRFVCIWTYSFRKMRFTSTDYAVKRQVQAFLLVFFIESSVCQIRYSVPEEMRKGSYVGNIAEDLGVDAKRLKSGGARIVSGDGSEHIKLDVDKGNLVVGNRIDREQLCGQTSPCSIEKERSHILRRSLRIGLDCAIHLTRTERIYPT
uniref:Cadherin N-terminal domain-containing protein n=1 Tax=Fundulus heteroclitus TaxID=8078 RepID=A0A3Q2PH16_FUNHE